MSLPYEKQITRLLQELMHFRAVEIHCRQERARYAEELSETCNEIEQALYEMGNCQKIALNQWRNISQGDRSRILSPVSEGVEKMTVLAQQEGCKAMGEYLEASVMEEILMLLDLPEK